jgi:hypothetical protein
MHISIIKENLILDYTLQFVMGPKTGRITKRNSRGKKGPSLLSEQLLEEYHGSGPGPSSKAQSVPETTEDCQPSSPTRKRTQRCRNTPKFVNEQLTDLPQVLGPKLSLGAESIPEVTDECVPQKSALSRKRSWVVESPLRQQSRSLAAKRECEFEDSIQDGSKLPDSPTDSRLLDHCLSIVRQNQPLVGFHDSTPLGGTVWDSLCEMESTSAGEALWGPTIHLEAEGIEQLPQIEQVRSVSVSFFTPIRQLSDKTLGTFISQFTRTISEPTEMEKLWDYIEKPGVPMDLI